MDILYKNKKMQRRCDNPSSARYGEKRAKKLKQRLSVLQAAETLKDVRAMPPARCHELTGNLAGLLSVDLEHSYHLLFEPANEPIPRKKDGGLDWSQVTAVMISDIRDIHE